LKSDYTESASVEECLDLAAKVLLKTMDTATPTPDKVEFSVLRRDGRGGVAHVVLTEDEVQTILTRVQEQLQQEQRERTAATATQGDI
jgi:20S proteasome subunit alpha 3